MFDVGFVSDLFFRYGIPAIKVCGLFVGAYFGTDWIKVKIYTYLAKIYPDELRSELLARIASYIFLFVLIAAILFEFGINVAALLGAAGIVGVAIAYASQTSVSNIVSGLFLMVERPFELNHLLVVGSTKGRVASVNLFSVTLRTKIGTLVRIPHEHLLKTTFTNVTRLPLRRYDVTFMFDRTEDVEKVRTLLEAVAKSNKLSESNSEPSSKITKISGSFIKIELSVWALQKNMTDLEKTLLLDLKRAFDEQSIALTECSQGTCHEQ